MLITKEVTAAAALGDLAGQIRGMSLAAVGLVEWSENERALRYADQALSLAARNPEVRFPLMAHMAKAAALDALGRPAEAQQFLDRALAFVDAAEMKVYRADVLIALGERAAKAKKRDQAIQYFEDAVRAAAAVEMPRPQAAALFHLADLYVDAGDLPRAEERVVEGLRESRELVDMYVLPQHLAVAAEIKSRLGKVSEAVALYNEATDDVEGMLVNVPSPTLRTRLIAAMSRIYTGNFVLAVNQLNDVRKAFYIVERARGRVAADELRTRSFDQARYTPALAAADRAITQIQIRLQRARDPKDRRKLLQELFVAEENRGPALFEQQQVKKFGAADPVTVPELRQALRSDEVLIEYVLTDPASYAVVISKTTIRAHKLPAGAVIRELVERFRRDIRAHTEPSAVGGY